MTKMQKFTPLSQDRIHKAVSAIHPNFYYAAAKVKSIIDKQGNESYIDLISRFNATKDEEKKEFIEKNSALIIKFLNECGLIGYKDETREFNEKFYIIGAEGVEIMLAYLRGKDKNSAAHEVQTVKNINLITRDESKKYIKIFLEQNQVHDGLKNQLEEDLKKAKDQDYSKTYVVEMFGTTGGSHILCVTLHMQKGEPIVHIFDSSPAIVRNGVEAATNSLAHGWSSQIILNATFKKVFGEKFKSENFFMNSEPLQSQNTSLCAIFAYEMAYQIAKLSREEHIALLRKKYIHKSPYSGLTDIKLDIDRIIEQTDGFVQAPVLGLDASDVFMSHFMNTAIAPRENELKTVPHLRKSGEVESQYDRIERYKSDDNLNKITFEKSIRQRLAHLFEIVINPEFLELAKDKRAQEAPSLPEIIGFPFFAEDAEFEKPSTEETIKLVEAFNKLMSPPSPVNKACSSSFDGKNCVITVYLGDITAQKLRDFMTENGIETKSETIEFSDHLIQGVHPKFSQIQKIETIIPRTKFDDLIAKIESMGSKSSLVTKQPHSFSPPENAPTQSQAKQISDSEAKKSKS